MPSLRLCIYFNPIRIGQEIVNPLIGGDKIYYESDTIYCFPSGCVVHEMPFYYKIVTGKGVVNIWTEAEGIIHMKHLVCIEAHGEPELLYRIMSMLSGYRVKKIRVW